MEVLRVFLFRIHSISVFLFQFLFIFPFILGMSHGTSRGEGRHLCCLHKGCLFSNESYFSLSKHIRNWRNYRQTEAFVISPIMGNEVEPMQGARYVAGTEEQVFVNYRGQLDSIYDIEVGGVQVIHEPRWCWSVQILWCI